MTKISSLGNVLRLFGGSGNDILDASAEGSNNRIFGGDGDDDFFLGDNDQIAGGEGSDRFFVGVNDSRDLDFEITPSFNFTVKAIDEKGLSDTADISINLNDVNELTEPISPSLILNEDNSFTISGDEAVRLGFQLLSSRNDSLKEVGVYAVEDEFGTINGLQPGDTGYIQAALSQSQARVILSTLSNPPNGFATDLSRIIEGFRGSDRLAFYLVRDSTSDEILAGKASQEQVIFGSSFNQTASNALQVEQEVKGQVCRSCSVK